MNEIDDELNIYYAIRNQDSTTYSSWDDIERLFSEIVSSSEHTTWWQHIPTLRSRGCSVQELSIALARFQVQQITDDSFTERIHYEAYERGTPSYLKEYIEAGMKERPSFPTGPVADLLGFLERRRSKGLELLVILAAAIIGGVTGSLLTILASQAQP